MKVILFFFLFPVFYACKSNERSASIAMQNPPLIIFNIDSTLLLEQFFIPDSPENPIPIVRFSVIDPIHSDTLYRDFENNSNVEWFDKYHLKITKIPGTITSAQLPEDHIYILNPLIGKLYKLKDHLNSPIYKSNEH